MENHPIPQDVTGFKFKLIGSITLKQFFYLLGAGILATIVFILPIAFFIKIPFMMLFASVGLALAFLPLDGRPMDLMIINFIKTIPSENEYIYKKRGANIMAFEFFKPVQANQPEEQKAENASDAKVKKSLFLSQMRNSAFRPDENELQFLNNIKSFFEESAVQTVTTSTQAHSIVQPVTPSQETKKIETTIPVPPLKKETEENLSKLQKELQDAQALKKKGVSSEALEEKIKELEARLTEALGQKEALEKKVFEIARERVNEQVYHPKTADATTQNVRIVAPSAQLQTGFPILPDKPNIILGIIKDPRGKVLQNILVEVVDKNSVPVRTFKTNALGQFIAATPLQNGTYNVIFEDPQKNHEFDSVEITLSGNIFEPLEVISVDAREKLRRELFEN